MTEPLLRSRDRPGRHDDAARAARYAMRGAKPAGEFAMKGTMRVLSSAVLLVLSASASAAVPFEGKFSANGKDAKLAFLMARKGDPFSGKPVTVLIFSEKDASKDKRPDFAAQMGDFGDALVIRLSGDGKAWNVIGSELTHSALKHSGVSASGMIDVKDVSIANGEISGRLLTAPKADIFGEPVAIDLKFHVRQP
jgi:hypothetical protein